MVGRAHTGTIYYQLEVGAGKSHSLRPAGRCAYTPNGKGMCAVIQAAHHVHVDHAGYLVAIQPLCLYKSFRTVEPQLLAREVDEHIVEVFQLFVLFNTLRHLQQCGCAAGIIIGTVVNLVLFFGIGVQAVVVFAIAQMVVVGTQYYGVFCFVVYVGSQIVAIALRAYNMDIKVCKDACFGFFYF
jgi:hypothetical protein